MKDSDMPDPIAPTEIIAILRGLGARPYDAIGTQSSTVKLERLRLPNGRPIAVEKQYRFPSIWMLDEHAGSVLPTLGDETIYTPERGKHSNLKAIREFRGKRLMKVIVTEADIATIRAALGRLAESALREVA